MRRLILSLLLLLPLSLYGQLGGGLFAPEAVKTRSVTFANLGGPLDGSFFYCSNCTQAAVCASGGSGAFALRINGGWTCMAGSGVPTFPIAGTAGTAAAPTYGFGGSGEGDTGMFLSGANAIGFSTNGTERWTLSASGGWNCTTDGGCTVGNGAADPATVSVKTGIDYRGATSGVTRIIASAVAGSTTATLPAANDTLVGKATTDVLTNKSISLASNTVTSTSAQLAAALSDETGTGLAVFGTSPVLTTPTGIVKGDVGLGNVDNTSDATKNSAVATLTNKSIPILKPASDSTTAIQVTKADGTTVLATVDTTNSSIGINGAASTTAGMHLLLTDNTNVSNTLQLSNSDAADTGALSDIGVLADTAQIRLRAHGTARTSTAYGVARGGYSELSVSGGNGLLLGTTNSAPIRIGTNSTVGAIMAAATQILSLPPLNLTAGTMTATNTAEVRVVVSRYDWTNAMVTALGATTAGDIAVCTLPAKTVVRNVYIVIDTPDTSSNALTVAVGRTSAAYIDYIVASDAKGAANTVYGDASAERGTNLTGYDLPSPTGTTVINAHFVKTTTNLSTVTASTGHIYIVTEALP